MFDAQHAPSGPTDKRRGVGRRGPDRLVQEAEKRLCLLGLVEVQVDHDIVRVVDRAAHSFVAHARRAAPIGEPAKADSQTSRSVIECSMCSTAMPAPRFVLR